MEIFLTKSSAREARKCKVPDKQLFEGVQRARMGLVDASLAATLIKQEVARPPEGRKTACRAIIAMRSGGNLAVVMHVYAKSDKADLTPREVDAYADLSQTLVNLTADQIEALIQTRGWRRIEDG